MNTIYFLAAVAGCALILVVLVTRSNRDKRDRPSARKESRHAQPLYQHRMAGHTVLHSHTGHPPSERSEDPWHTKRRHAQKERWEEVQGEGKPSHITATRLRSDEELEKATDDDDEMTMGEIQYTPTDFTKVAGRNR